MPHWFQEQKIKLPREHDRRVHITEEDKEYVKKLYNRKNTIRKLRGMGWSYQKIGEKLGISKQRVFQIDKNPIGGVCLTNWHAPYASNKERIAARRIAQKRSRNKIYSTPELLERMRKYNREYKRRKYAEKKQKKENN